MLGGVDRALGDLPPRAARYMQEQLVGLVTLFAKAISPPLAPVACPVYDPTGISFAVHEAVTNFSGPWLAKLGISHYDGVRREHWTRIRALDRRIASEQDVEYDSLRPVADLLARLQEAISRLLDKPHDWTQPPTSEQEEQDAIAIVRMAVFTALHSLTVKRLIADQLALWREAYEFRGTGSTFDRAKVIRAIYEDAAPLPGVTMTPKASDFLREVRQLLKGAIEQGGGHLQLDDAA